METYPEQWPGKALEVAPYKKVRKVTVSDRQARLKRISGWRKKKGGKYTRTAKLWRAA